jgi:hypothetical protein
MVRFWQQQSNMRIRAVMKFKRDAAQQGDERPEELRWNCCGGGEVVFGASAAALDYAVKNQMGLTENESCEKLRIWENLCSAGNL